MNKVLATTILLLLCTAAISQSIEKSQAEMIYDVVPSTTPCTYCSEVIFVRADTSIYRWDGDSWELDDNLERWSLVQDSILVSTKLGVVVRRDTIRTPGGESANQTASEVPITDAGGYYTTNNVEDALQEEAVNRIAIDLLLGDVLTALGISATDTDMGAYTGGIITDNTTQTAINQELSDAIEAGGGSADLTGLDGSVIIAPVGGAYESVAHLVTDGVADQLQFKQALDSLNVLGYNKILFEGPQYWANGDSLLLDESNDSYTIEGIRELRQDTIYLAAGFDGTKPAIKISPTDTDSIKVALRNFVIDGRQASNAEQFRLNNGVIRHNGGVLDYVEYTDLSILTTGNFTSAIAHRFSDTITPGRVNRLVAERNYIYVDGRTSAGQYGIITSIPTYDVTFNDNILYGDGFGTGGNFFNIAAFYGGGKRISAVGNYIFTNSKTHSPLAFSPFSYINVTNNTVIGGENENFEGLIEVERKAHTIPALASAPVEYFNVSNNTCQWLNRGPTPTAFGVYVTDRQPAVGDTIRPTGGTISGNTIINADIGINLEYSNNVIPSGNTYIGCDEDISYGRTDQGKSILGKTHYNTLLVDGDNEWVGLYDGSSVLDFDTIFSQVPGLGKFKVGQLLAFDYANDIVTYGSANRLVNYEVFASRFNVTNIPHALYIGEDAGEFADLTLGTNATFGGYRGGRYNRNRDNTGFGSLTMSSSGFSGRKNSSLGAQSLLNCTTCEDVASGGYRNLQSLTVGTQNASWGTDGFRFMTSGVQNSGLGQGHGANSNGSRGTYLGALTGPTVSNTLNDVIYIGFSVGGNNTRSGRLMIDVTNTETPLLDGDMLADSLRVNGDFIVAGDLTITGSINTSENFAVANTVTSGRPAQWNGTGNQLDAFPLENTLGLVRQTQTTAFEMARGTTGEAPLATTPGRLRWNTTFSKPTVSDGSNHVNIATENYVDDKVVDTDFTEDTDISINPISFTEIYTLSTTASATSNTRLTLPLPSSTHAGKTITVWSVDDHGTHDNEVHSAGNINNQGTVGTTITLSNNQATSISCVQTGASVYSWIVTNQY